MMANSVQNSIPALAITPESLNPYLVLYHRKIVLFREAVTRIEEVFGR